MIFLASSNEALMLSRFFGSGNSLSLSVKFVISSNWFWLGFAIFFKLSSLSEMLCARFTLLNFACFSAYSFAKVSPALYIPSITLLSGLAGKKLASPPKIPPATVPAAAVIAVVARLAFALALAFAFS